MSLGADNFAPWTHLFIFFLALPSVALSVDLV